MDSAAAKKLKNSTPTLVDPECDKLITELYQQISRKWVVFSSIVYALPLLDAIIDKFLHTYAYISGNNSEKIHTYEPFHVGLSETWSHSEFGLAKRWLAYYTNCFILYIEYPEHPDIKELFFFVDKETYEKHMKPKDDNS